MDIDEERTLLYEAGNTDDLNTETSSLKTGSSRLIAFDEGAENEQE